MDQTAASASATAGAPLLRRIDRCPLCDGQELEVVRSEKHDFPPDDFFRPYAQYPIELRQCARCEFVFVDAVPIQRDFYERHYSHDLDWYSEFNYHGKKLIAADIRSRLQTYGARGKLLDIGAWAGTLLAALSDRFETHGVEINDNAAAYAREQGFDVRTGSFGDVDLSALAPFDVVTLIDVLEHLPHPHAVLAQVERVLRPGGIVAIKVPHYFAQAAKQDVLQRLRLSTLGVAQNYSHINHFSPKSLGFALESHGFEVLELVGAKAEIWSLEAPLPRRDKARRFFKNLVRNLGTESLNAVAALGLQCALNIQAIARKR